jgi:hypothetical protein
MSTYRFIGTEAEIAGQRTLKHFGQSVELPDDVAAGLILGAGAEQGHAGAVALLPDGDFKALGFTKEELQYFGSPGAQFGDKAKEFLEKKKAAVEALHSYRESIEPKPIEKPIVTEEATDAH